MPNIDPLRAIFVTGTDTGVGKTHVAALILRQLRNEGRQVGAYKPACSGATQLPDGSWIWEDLVRLKEAIGDQPFHDREPHIDIICPQRFRTPVAPPVAARLEQHPIDSELLAEGVNTWRGRAEGVVIEGVGGWLCPVSDEWTIADLAVRWKVPVLIVSRRGLGTINHTLLTIESVRSRGLSIAGIILNEAEPIADDPSIADNAAEIERRSGVPVLAELLHGDTGELRRAGVPVRIRWWELMGPLRGIRSQVSGVGPETIPSHI